MPFAQKLSFFLRYLSNPPWDTGITPPELVTFVSNHAPGRALELGCGTGTNAIYLAKHDWQVTAIDFVASAINKARTKAMQEGVGVNFLVEDVSQFSSSPNSFDLILDIGCFHSLSEKDREAYLRNVNRLLDPQGILLLYAMVSETDDKFGLSSSDLEQMRSFLELIDRQDGTDRGRHSAWFTWHKPVDFSPVQ
jgi:ubiquinone/menaquinone biosynthesis C-methylase UbiE